MRGRSRKSWSRSALFLALLTFAACRSTDATAEEAASDRREVLDLLATLPRDLAREGPLGWARHFPTEGSFLMAVDGDLKLRDPAEARAHLEAIATEIEGMTLAFRETRIDRLADGLAAIGAGYDEEVRDRSATAQHFVGYLTALVEKQEGHWVFRQLHWSSRPEGR